MWTVNGIDPATLGPAPRRIVANLPYNISTPLLVGWLQRADAITDMVLTIPGIVLLAVIVTTTASNTPPM